MDLTRDNDLKYFYFICQNAYTYLRVRNPNNLIWEYAKIITDRWHIEWRAQPEGYQIKGNKTYTSDKWKKPIDLDIKGV